MKRWQWAVLIFELALFALILILPQVDLPDFTFHGMTAPVAAKARVSAPPARAFVVPVRTPLLRPAPEKLADAISPTTPADSNSRLSVLCTRLC
jgi:hypothetical protein